MNYIDTVEYRLKGIPCLLGVISYESGEEPYLSGHPDDAFPGYSPQINWHILDRRGRKADWLERKVTKKDDDEIYEVLCGYFGG